MLQLDATAPARLVSRAPGRLSSSRSLLALIPLLFAAGWITGRLLHGF